MFASLRRSTGLPHRIVVDEAVLGKRTASPSANPASVALQSPAPLPNIARIASASCGSDMRVAQMTSMALRTSA